MGSHALLIGLIRTIARKKRNIVHFSDGERNMIYFCSAENVVNLLPPIRKGKDGLSHRGFPYDAGPSYTDELLT